MAVRRAVRRGLLLSEQSAPTASTSTLPALCAGCSSTRSLSSALQLNPTRTDSSPSTPSLSRQAATGWAALSKASQSIFNTAEGGRGGATAVEGGVEEELSPTAVSLIEQLKLPRADPHQVWSLFSQLDLEGTVHTLPLYSLHALLPAIHIKPYSSRAKPLSLSTSSSHARQYALKVDLIRTRLSQAGGTASPGDFIAILNQYRTLLHAPGVSRTWDELLDAGIAPKASLARAVLETYLGWIEMHGRTSGRAVERAAAEPLVRKAVSVLADVQGSGRKVTTAAVELLLKIAVKAGDLDVFAQAVKQFYAVDIKLPGASRVDVAAGAGVAEVGEVGEAEVALMLEALADKDDLSSMIAIFETFDRPTPPPSAVADDSTFFSRSFSSPSSSSSPPSDASARPTTPEKPHPIGTRAFTTVIQTAARLENGAVARHYFDLLNRRWQLSTEERLNEIEAAVGIDGGVEEAAVEVAQTAETVVQAVETPVVKAPLRTSSIATKVPLHLVVPPTPPATPYTLPSSVLATMAHHALVTYDTPTARWLRRRTITVIQLLEAQTARLTAVLARLEPTDSHSSSSSDASESSPESLSAPPPSLVALQRELALSAFHLDQLRLTLASVKLDTNIIVAHKHLHTLQSDLSARARALSSPTLSAKEKLRARPALRRKEKQVLLAKMVVVRHRLTKLREVEQEGPGKSRWESYMAEYRVLKGKYEGQGWTELSGEGETLGASPHVDALRAVQQQ